MLNNSWYTINGYFSEDEGAKLQELSKGKVCLEIGSYCGKSSVCMGLVCQQLYCIDTFKADTSGQDQANGFTTLDEFIKNIVGLPIKYFIGKSEDVLPTIDLEFDLVFIDGMHDYDSVMIDIYLSYPKLKSNGIMTFHDYGPYGFESVTNAIDNFFGKENILGPIRGFAWSIKK